jgi:hypothetical protein
LVHIGCEQSFDPIPPIGETEPEKCTIRLHGTVTAAADSSPIANARVTAYVYGGEYLGVVLLYHRSSGTDDQGHYELSLFQVGSEVSQISFGASASTAAQLFRQAHY